mgnify:CR=1 FL=1
MRLVIGILVAPLVACGFTPSGDVDGSTDDAAALDGPATDAGPLDAPPDARAIDARAIDAPPPCPVTYPGGYRVITASQSWRAAEADCEDDTAGLSHLAVIDDAVELAAINAALTAAGAPDVWVGVMRDAPNRGAALKFLEYLASDSAQAYLAEGNNPDQPGRLVQWLFPRVPCFTYRIGGTWLQPNSLVTKLFRLVQTLERQFRRDNIHEQIDLRLLFQLFEAF